MGKVDACIHTWVCLHTHLCTYVDQKKVEDIDATFKYFMFISPEVDSWIVSKLHM